LYGRFIEKRMAAHDADVLHSPFNRNLDLQHDTPLNSGRTRKRGIGGRNRRGEVRFREGFADPIDCSRGYTRRTRLWR
jgi:hypothetical protein